MTKDKSLIQSCIDHINTAIDVDPWAKEMVTEWGKRELEQLKNSNQEVKKSNDCISRQAAIDALCAVCGKACDKSEFVYNAPQDEQVILCPEHYCLCNLPSAQPEQRWETCFDCPLSHGCPKIRGCANDQAVQYASEIPADCPLSIEPERKKDIIQKFHDYQIDWLKSHYDIELEPQLEEMIVRFLHDTANCYMMEIDREEGGQNG